ncbi:22231_t:CDS:1, partial [Gigaspora margarita]
DSNKKNESINVQLRNSRKVITRGRPKSVSYHNNEKNRKNKSTMQELTTYKKRKHRSNFCSNCKKPSKNNIEQTNEKETDEEIDEETDEEIDEKTDKEI